jgi:AcrR family transcriptional regulator
MKKRDKAREIMESVMKLALSRRFHEIRLEDVAQAARVGKGTIYLYFRDKEDLIFQTIVSGLDELCSLLNRRVPEDAPFTEQLFRECVEISAFFERRRQLLRMIQSEETHMQKSKRSIRDRWMEERQKLVAAVAKIIEKGMAEGRIRTDIPSHALANFLLGMLRTRARDLSGMPESMSSLKIVVDLFVRGASRVDGISRSIERSAEMRRELCDELLE